jgi:hypothetical protein
VNKNIISNAIAVTVLAIFIGGGVFLMKACIRAHAAEPPQQTRYKPKELEQSLGVATNNQVIVIEGYSIANDTNVIWFEDDIVLVSRRNKATFFFNDIQFGLHKNGLVVYKKRQ